MWNSKFTAINNSNDKENIKKAISSNLLKKSVDNSDVVIHRKSQQSVLLRNSSKLNLASKESIVANKNTFSVAKSQRSTSIVNDTKFKIPFSSSIGGDKKRHTNFTPFERKQSAVGLISVKENVKSDAQQFDETIDIINEAMQTLQIHSNNCVNDIFKMEDMIKKMNSLISNQLLQVLFLSLMICSSVTCQQLVNIVPYTLKDPFKQTVNANVLLTYEPPTIIKELPLSVSFYSNEVLKLRCGIRGNPTPTYQWYVSKSDMTDSSITVQDQNYDLIRSANNETLTIDGKMANNTKNNYSKYAYYCSARNPFGILLTNKVVVEKVPRPTSLSIKYIPHPVYKGEKFVVQCNLEPDIISLYKFKHWEVHLKFGEILKINETGGRFSVILSTKFPQLHIRNVTDDDFIRTKFRCIFQSSIDNRDDVLFNIPQSIEESSHGDMRNWIPHGFVGETVSAFIGNNIELPFCSVPRTVNVSWYKIDADDSTKKVEVGNKANDTKFKMIDRRYGNLLIMNVTKADVGKYSVESNSRRLEMIFTLNINEIPVVNLSPRNIQSKLSESAVFLCDANFQKGEFRWLHNGQRIVNGSDNGNVEVVTTGNTSIMTVKNVRFSVSGVYQCIAIFIDEIKSQSYYRQISGTLLLSEVPPKLVKQSPLPKIDASTAHIKMSQNDMFTTIECVFTANPIPNIDWYHNFNKVQLLSPIKVNIEQDQNSIYNFITKITISLREISKGENIRKYAGEYRAIATNSLGSAVCNTLVFVDGDLELKLPKEQTVIGGFDYILTCFFVASELPEFSWHRKIGETEPWQSLPYDHRTVRLENNHRMLLTNVLQYDDQGLYRCTIQLNKDTKVAITRLRVVYPPLLHSLPTINDRNTDQVHFCTIRRITEEPWYSWWTFTKYPSNETTVIYPITNATMFTVYNYKTSNYTKRSLPGIPEFVYKYPNSGVDLIVRARPNENDPFGKFTCHARNQFGFDEKTIKDVFLKFEFKEMPRSLSEVVVGESLYLNCAAVKSDLDVVVRWRLWKDVKTFVDISDFKSENKDRMFQYNNGTVVVKNIKESDPSKLICFIFPIRDRKNFKTKISYIDIRVPARIEELDREMIKVAGSSFNLSCHVFGHDHNMQIIWHFRSSNTSLWKKIYDGCFYFNKNPCLNQLSLNNMSFMPINVYHNRTLFTVHLEFRNAPESISGHYKCEAINKFNKEMARRSTVLTIISKPSVVIVDTTQESSSSTSISFQWKPPEKDGRRNIFQYIINYYEVPSITNNGEPKNMTQRTIRVNNTVNSIVINQLRPFIKYGINIAAENEVGVSDVATIYITTQEAPPQKPINNLMASSTKPHEILISWSEPDPEFQNGYIIRYQVCYQIIEIADESKTGIALDRLNWPDNSANLSEYPKVTCLDTDTRTITVSYLPQFTDFAIRVIAFNTKGGSPSLFTKVRTLEDLPQAAPSLVTCERQNQAIALTWNPPGRQTINGVLKGYVVYYYEPNKYNDESFMKSLSVQGQTSVVIEHLKPYTPYSIQVMAENRKGLGPPSISVFCTTKEAKPEAPEMVKAMKINSTCIYVSWLHSPNPNGKIIEYCVAGVYSVNSRKCQPPAMNRRYNTMLFCDNNERLSAVEVYARNQFDGVIKEASVIDDANCIISIGGHITVDESKSVILPCETVSLTEKNIYWKKDGLEFRENENPNIKILKNFSLEISEISKLDSHVYMCSTESDSIEYRLTVKESSDGIPRIPIIDDFRVTENSVFIRWKSQGTSDMAVPITRFIINWENQFTGDSKTVTVGDTARSFYLNNVTCASNFFIKVSSQSGNGRSQYCEPKLLRTRGSVPLIADTSILLPRKNIYAHSANFNLLAFEAGDNCSAMFFIIKISLPSIDHHSIKNVSVYELTNKCCYNFTDLHPMTEYKYVVTAYNPAGSTQSNDYFRTPNIRNVLRVIDRTDTFGNNFWILITVFIIVLIFVLIVIIVGVLQIVRFKAKKSQNAIAKSVIRKSDYNPNRIEKPGNHDDTASIGSEPSPYAVYQPDTAQQASQQNFTPLYNYTEHPYNQIRYDKILGRPIALEKRRYNHRRVNSAECLSSLGNASVAGIADLESPNNIDPNDYFRAPNIRNGENDEAFRNIQFPDFSTVSRKKLRRESQSNDEESSRLMRNNSNQGAMSSSRNYESRASRVQQSQQPQKKYEEQSMYPISGHTNRHIYRQQMSVPEQESKYNQQYGYRSNRVRTTSGPGRNHRTSQMVLPHSAGSSGQASGFGSYHGSRGNNMQPNVRRDNEPPNHHYSAYIAGSGLSNYNPGHRTVLTRPALQTIESPNEGIYSDRVIVV